MKYRKLKPNEYAPSLLQTEKKCYICGTTCNLELHHIYSGAYRNKSSYYGCWVWLCRSHHTGTEGVHLNYLLMKKLREECQLAFEKKYPKLDFKKLFGRNYI